ncbi:hypothetical protein IL306_013422 [Fusarium sp. DS 682]|nr:hypothetical protein IL306_013422 [Fusarium sp. DS 682]
MGFSKQNVKALCSVGNSSKSGLGQIGQKGIGFKSVFQYADVVWIKSGYYSFKLDKYEKLGRITPAWGTFPEEVRPGFTSILLKLSTKCDMNWLEEEIRALDSKLFMFLRKLRKITINHGAGGTSKRTLRLMREPNQEHGLDFISLQQEGRSMAYRVFHHQVSQLPKIPERGGSRLSTLSIAFPSEIPAEQDADFQDVYAFLPIRDYGFKFALHADFILTANREDIDPSSPWNQAIRKQIPHAILSAIQRLNSGELRYSWFRYLPPRDSGGFFQHLAKDTIDLLSDQWILESREGKLMTPPELVLVPKRLADAEGKPFVPVGRSKLTYLSHKYPPSSKSELERLGVVALSSQGFVDDLRAFISENRTEFQQMPPKWHSQLSKVLHSLAVEDDHLRSDISSLPIIQLRDNRWVSSREEKTIFPLTSSGFQRVPRGILVSEVHPDADQDENRHLLLLMLKTKEYCAENIHNLIFEAHEKAEFRKKELSIDNIDDLVSHSSPAAGMDCNLWFVAEDKSCHLGSTMYLNTNGPYTAAQMFGQEKSKFLHPRYLKISSTHWQEWLMRNLKIQAIPRLVAISYKPEESFTMADDFRILIRSCQSSELLLLLREHWEIYSEFIVQKGRPYGERSAWAKSQENLRNTLSSIEVRCREGVIARLSEALLPRDSLHPGDDNSPRVSAVNVSKFDGGRPNRYFGLINYVWQAIFGIRGHCQPRTTIPVLDIPEPDNCNWDFLEHLGVALRLEARHFLNDLQMHQDARTADAIFVSKIYMYLEACPTAKEELLIRRAFQEGRLVFVESGDGDPWLNLSSCIWDGPQCLRIPRLKAYYPQRERLFRSILRLPDANLKTLINEAVKFDVKDKLQYIAEITLAISNLIQKSGLEDAAKLKSCSIFPIRSIPNLSGFDTLSTAESGGFYIADRPHFEKTFRGKLNVLAFDVKTVHKMKPLIEALGLKARLLSQAATKVESPEGSTLSKKYTKFLQERLKWIVK